MSQRRGFARNKPAPDTTAARKIRICAICARVPGDHIPNASL